MGKKDKYHGSSRHNGWKGDWRGWSGADDFYDWDDYEYGPAVGAIDRVRGGPAPEPAPPLDPALVAAMLAQTSDIRLDAAVDATPAPTKLTTIVRDAAGVWLVKRTPTGVATTLIVAWDSLDKAKFTVPAVLTAGEKVMKAGFTPLYAPLPWEMFRQVVAWFRDVNTRHKTEAYVQVWHDRGEDLAADSRDPSRLFFHVPEQDVSGGMVEHEGEFDKDSTGRFVHVMDIHSHHTMGAFWSGTDDKDERRFERVYGVVGHIDKPMPMFKWRTAVGGVFIDLEMEAVVAIPDVRHPFTVSLAGLMKSGQVDLSKVAIDPFEGATFPEEWNKSLVTTPRRVVPGFRGSRHVEPVAGRAPGGTTNPGLLSGTFSSPLTVLVRTLQGGIVRRVVYFDTSGAVFERVSRDGHVVDRLLSKAEIDDMCKASIGTMKPVTEGGVQ